MINKDNYDLTLPSIGNISNITGIGKSVIGTFHENDKSITTSPTLINNNNNNHTINLIPLNMRNKTNLKLLTKKYCKFVIKTSGRSIKTFFKLLRKSIRYGTRKSIKYGPIILKQCFDITTSSLYYSYIYIRDHTIGPPINPKKIYPKNELHWNSIPKIQKSIIPIITPLPNPLSLRKKSIMSSKLKLKNDFDNIDNMKEIDPNNDDNDNNDNNEEDNENIVENKNNRRNSIDSNKTENSNVSSEIEYSDSDDSSDNNTESNEKISDNKKDSKQKRGMTRKRQKIKMGWMMYAMNTIYETVMGRPPPKETLLEKRQREQEKQEKVFYLIFYKTNIKYVKYIKYMK